MIYNLLLILIVIGCASILFYKAFKLSTTTYFDKKRYLDEEEILKLINEILHNKTDLSTKGYIKKSKDINVNNEGMIFDIESHPDFNKRRA